ncbi:hypothetical protein EDD22DRAFT_885496 [Suillus occidentalis]|nr:hypothetical protein EDD22DRAFT_885496 [Suillus occidentalis]
MKITRAVVVIAIQTVCGDELHSRLDKISRKYSNKTIRITSGGYLRCSTLWVDMPTLHEDNKIAGPGRSVRLDFKHHQRGPAVYSQLQKTAFGQYKILTAPGWNPNESETNRPNMSTLDLLKRWSGGPGTPPTVGGCLSPSA